MSKGQYLYVCLHSLVFPSFFTKPKADLVCLLSVFGFVWQQWSGLASVIDFCQRVCQLVPVQISFQSPQWVFLGRVFTKPSKANFSKGQGTSILGNVFRNCQSKIEHEDYVAWERVAAVYTLSSWPSKRATKSPNVTSHLVSLCLRVEPQREWLVIPKGIIRNNSLFVGNLMFDAAIIIWSKTLLSELLYFVYKEEHPYYFTTYFLYIYPSNMCCLVSRDEHWWWCINAVQRFCNTSSWKKLHVFVHFPTVLNKIVWVLKKSKHIQIWYSRDKQKEKYDLALIWCF